MYLVHNRLTGKTERVRVVNPRIHSKIDMGKSPDDMEVEQYERNRAEDVSLPKTVKSGVVDKRGVNNVNSEYLYKGGMMGGMAYQTGGPYIKTLKEPIHPTMSKGLVGLGMKKYSPKDVMSEIEKQFSEFKINGKKSVQGGMLKQL